MVSPHAVGRACTGNIMKSINYGWIDMNFSFIKFLKSITRKGFGRKCQNLDTNFGSAWLRHISFLLIIMITLYPCAYPVKRSHRFNQLSRHKTSSERLYTSYRSIECLPYAAIIISCCARISLSRQWSDVQFWEFNDSASTFSSTYHRYPPPPPLPTYPALPPVLWNETEAPNSVPFLPELGEWTMAPSTWNSELSTQRVAFGAMVASEVKRNNSCRWMPAITLAWDVTEVCRLGEE